MGKSRTMKYQVGRQYKIDGRIYSVVGSRSTPSGTVAILEDLMGNQIKRKS